MEENCEYYGDAMMQFPAGEIADANHCQELCEEFVSMGCKYWTFEINVCTLLTSGERKCNSLGGAKYPAIEDCIGNMFPI